MPFGSPFERQLAELGIELVRGLSIALMCERGWIKPALRVVLPRAAFDAWRNYPTVSPLEADDYPPEYEGALSLYIRAMTGTWPRRDDCGGCMSSMTMPIHSLKPLGNTRWIRRRLLPCLQPFGMIAEARRSDPGSTTSRTGRHFRSQTTLGR